MKDQHDCEQNGSQRVEPDPVIELVAVSRHHDRARIEAWLSTAHVSRWWGNAADCLRKFDATPDDNHAIIARDGNPVGYIRWETVDPEALREVGLDEIPDGSVDVDLFVGDTQQTGCGVGPRAIEQLVEMLRATTHVPLVGFCTSVENQRAHAAFRKAGCTMMTTFDDPTYGPCHVFGRWLR